MIYHRILKWTICSHHTQSNDVWVVETNTTEGDFQSDTEWIDNIWATQNTKNSLAVKKTQNEKTNW